MSFCINFSCYVSGNAVPDALALDRCGCMELVLVLIEIVRKVLPLLCEECGTDVLDIRWLNSHGIFLKVLYV